MKISHGSISRVAAIRKALGVVILLFLIGAAAACNTSPASPGPEGTAVAPTPSPATSSVEAPKDRFRIALEKLAAVESVRTTANFTAQTPDVYFDGTAVIELDEANDTRRILATIDYTNLLVQFEILLFPSNEVYVNVPLLGWYLIESPESTDGEDAQDISSFKDLIHVEDVPWDDISMEPQPVSEAGGQAVDRFRVSVPNERLVEFLTLLTTAFFGSPGSPEEEAEFREQLDAATVESFEISLDAENNFRQAYLKVIDLGDTWFHLDFTASDFDVEFDITPPDRYQTSSPENLPNIFELFELPSTTPAQ